MEYVDIYPYFYCMGKMVVDLSNQSWAAAATATPHPILSLAYTPPAPGENARTGIIPSKLEASITACLLPNITFALLHYINVYVNDFVLLVQGGPA